VTARLLMKKDPIVLRQTDRLRDAAHLILKHHFRNVPVVDEGGRYLGVVSANRLLSMILPRAATLEESPLESLTFVKDTVEDLRARWRDVEDLAITDCLETGLETVQPDASMTETLLALYHNRTSLPVVEPESGRLVGIVSHWAVGMAIVGEDSL